MAIPLSGRGLATWDSNTLTKLVLPCHQARIRLHIGPNGPDELMLIFSRRAAGGGSMDAHPDIDEAVAGFRQYVGEDHRITYRETDAAVVA